MTSLYLLFCFVLAVIPVLCQDGSVGSGSQECVQDIDQNRYAPMDILFEIAARKALHEIRTYEEDDRGDDLPKPPSQRAQEVSRLIQAGHADLTTMTLKGKTESLSNVSNSDRSCIYAPFDIPNHSTPRNNFKLMAVFDGHAGDITVEFASQELPRQLSAQLGALDSLLNESAVEQAIKEAFLEVDRQDPSEGHQGTTASIILQLDSKVYLANVGNTGMWGIGLVDGYLNFMLESRVDSPDLPEERKRIEAMGGKVVKDANDPFARAYGVDEDGKLRHAVAVSRSIGDWAYIAGLVAIPTIQVVDLEIEAKEILQTYQKECEEQSSDCLDLTTKDVHFFAMGATDGVTEFPNQIGPRDLATVYGASFFVEDNPHPHTASETILINAARLWENEYDGEFRDNMVVAAMKLSI